MEWIELTRENIPLENEIVLVFSTTDGIGLGSCQRNMGISRHWIWLHKKVNGDKTINNVTHFCKIELPKTD